MTTHPAKPCPISPRRRVPARLRAPALAMAALGLLVITPLAVRATPGEILVITAEDVAFRAAPGSQSRIIERLGPHDRIMEFERRDGWVRGLLFGAIGQEGWVAARFLRPERDDAAGGRRGAGAAPSEGAIPDTPAEPGPSPDDGGDYSYRSRERVYLYCLDCGLSRRHDTRRRHRFHERKPVIRVVPEPKPLRVLPGR